MRKPRTVSGDVPAPPLKIAIVTPVLDDWRSLDSLVARLVQLPELQRHRIHVIAVDDGSATCEPPPAERLAGPVVRISVLRLKANQSHQRAIALGLAHVQRELDVDLTVVMDSDGEDRPEELGTLINFHIGRRDSIIVARRRKRSEGAGFRLGYVAYKLLFLLLTGRSISFGNFSLIPADRMNNVLFNQHIWNNFAATLLRSRVNIVFVDTDRGRRYFGKSRMNFTALVAHGMSAIAVFSDLVISRLIIGLGLLFTLFVLAVAGVFVAKTVIDFYKIPGLFIPGYATTVVLQLTNIIVTSLLVGLMAILSLLATRTQVAALPSQLIDLLVDDVVEVTPRAVLADAS